MMVPKVGQVVGGTVMMPGGYSVSLASSIWRERWGVHLRSSQNLWLALNSTTRFGGGVAE